LPGGSGKVSSTESLGTRVFEGVTAEGTRKVVSYPSDIHGNATTFSSKFETWYSPDLKIRLSMTNSDDRGLLQEYKLTNLRRDEPDLSLFQVPPEYRVVHEAGSFVIRYDVP